MFINIQVKRSEFFLQLSGVIIKADKLGQAGQASLIDIRRFVRFHWKQSYGMFQSVNQSLNCFIHRLSLSTKNCLLMNSIDLYVL